VCTTWPSHFVSRWRQAGRHRAMPGDQNGAGGGKEEILASFGDTGLAGFVSRLEEDLIRWHSEERVKAKERAAKGMRAEKDLVTVEASLRDSVAVQQLKRGSDDDLVEEKVEAMLQMGKEQREAMAALLGLVRGHTKAHLAQAGDDLLGRLPDEGQPLGLDSAEVPKLLQSFLDLCEGQAAPAAASASAAAPAASSRRAGGGGGRERTRKEKRRGREGGGRRGEGKRAKVDRGAKDRNAGRDEGAADDYSYDYDDSRSPSVEQRPQRPAGRGGARLRERGSGGGGAARRERDPRGGGGGGRPRRRREVTPSYDYSDLDSRSPSVDSRAAPQRRPHRGGGGGGPPGRGRRGGDRGGREDDRIDTRSEVERFVRVNKLEGKAEKVMFDLEPWLARRVMGLAGGNNNTFELSGDVRDPTAVVLARVRKERDQAQQGDRGGRGGPGGGGGGPPPRRRGGGGGRGRDSRSRSRSQPPRRGGPPPRRGGPPSQQQSVNDIPLGKQREFQAKET